MPLRNWIKLHDSNDYTQVLKSGTASLEQCIEQWTKLSDEFISKHGLSEDFKSYIEAVNEANILIAEYLITEDRFIEFQSRVKLQEVEALKFKGIKSTLAEEKTIIQRHIGMRIDDKEWTVDEYYYTIKGLKDGESNRK